MRRPFPQRAAYQEATPHMARAPKTPKPGENSAITEEELAALQHWFSRKIREGIKEHEAAKAIAKAKAEVVNGLFSSARGELHITRKDFEEMLAAEDMDEAEFLKAEAARAVRFKRQGLPVVQPDLFGDGPKAPDTADDKARAFAMGRKVGLAGGDRTPPDTIATFLHSDWLAGYDDGQDENGRLFILANEARAKLEKKDAKAKPKLTAVEGGKGKGGDKAKPAAEGEPAPDPEPPPIGGPTAEEMNLAPPPSDSESGQLTGGVLSEQAIADAGGAPGDDVDTASNVEGPFVGTEPAGDLETEEVNTRPPGTTDEEWDAAEARDAAARTQRGEDTDADEHPPIGEAP